MDENALRQLAVEFKTAIEDARMNGEFMQKQAALTFNSSVQLKYL